MGLGGEGCSTIEASGRSELDRFPQAELDTNFPGSDIQLDTSATKREGKGSSHVVLFQPSRSLAAILSKGWV